MFTALKYHAVDYLYEKMARQRFSFEHLSVNIPSCLYQDKNYYHEGGFVDDKYRRPWTRVSVDFTQLLVNFSVLDHWKQCLCVEDFLEKKPISSTLFRIHNEEIEVVPSSNPCSQFDIKDAYLLIKDDDREEFTGDNCLQSDYVPAVLKRPGEELYIEEELVFTDNLAQYAKQLPSLHALLSRLSVLQVQDPLLNSKGENITEEDIFRKCFTFEMKVTSQAKEKEPYEDFCRVTLRDEEAVILPIDLKCYKTSNLGLNTEVPTYLALKSLLEVTPEVVVDESESHKIDLTVKVTPDMEISEYCLTEEVCAGQSRNVQECSKPELLANHTPFYPEELEIPLTPLCRSEKMHMNLPYAELQSEPVSPFRESVLISESTKQYLEGLLWQSEKYQNPLSSLLIAEHQALLPTCQHLPVAELKKMLHIQKDTSVFVSLEEDGWINLRESLALPSVLEALSMDTDGGKNLVFTNVETYPKITALQLEEWHKEKMFTANCTASTDAPDSLGTKDPFWSPVYSENMSPENNGREGSIQSETNKPVHFENQEEGKKDREQPMDCQAVFVEPNRTLRDKPATPSERPRKHSDDFDLTSFIMLRSKHLSEETNNILDIQDEVLNAKEESPVSENQGSPVLNTTVPTEKETKENETVFIQLKPSESQFQAYHILEATVAPVLKQLARLGMDNWRFATLNFDDTRFFLKQQEKVINDTFKQGVIGAKNEKDITLFKHAAILHLVVTVRDLLLTCSLNTALGYLSKAKDKYKDFVGCSLDNLCRQLMIVQLAWQKKLEANPKTTELQRQIFSWKQNNTNEQKKVVIVTRTDDGDETAALIDAISTVQGLEVAYLNSEKRGALLESKNIITKLESCSCMVVYDQHIGPDFPWTYFSLVVEYNYSKNSCWIDLCKNQNIPYITFITTPPETVGNALEGVSPDDFGHILLEVQIPYVFLTSEGLLNTPEILQLLESKYNITFIERSCCEALQFFGSTDSYVVITVDEYTAVIMQNVEELNYEKSSDYVVLRLMMLSLQYTCFWIILYSRARSNSEYSLTGKTLHHLALIYAALVPFSQKSEDFEVKVVLTPGVEETALLIRQIADYVLMTSKMHPQEWLDKSWLSVLPSEAEKCLLTFPCVNPLVAQVMLKKSSSPEWILSATFNQLQELLPEVPGKVLKQFSDITSLYTLNPPTEPERQNGIVHHQEKMNSDISTCSPAPKALLSSIHRHSPLTEYSGCFNDIENSRSYSPDYYKKESCILLKPDGRHGVMGPLLPYKGEMCSFEETDYSREAKKQQHLSFLKNMEVEKGLNSSLPSFGRRNNFQATVPTLEYNQGGTNTYFEKCPGNEIYLSKVKKRQNLNVPVLVKNPPHQDISSVLGVRKQPLMKQHKSHPDSELPWYLAATRDDLPFQRESPEFQSKKRFWDDYPSAPTVDSSLHDPGFCKARANSERTFNLDFPIAEEYTGRKRLNLLSSSDRREQDVSAEFTQLPQLKKRRLTFEKDPGRSDGQTRLKFF